VVLVRIHHKVGDDNYLTWWRCFRAKRAVNAMAQQAPNLREP
jgi:hypothetical protein